MKRIVFIRVGWMQFYGSKPGIKERPIGGGSFNDTEVGHEAENFYIENDQNIYGFVQAGSKAGGFNIQSIDPATDKNSIDDVLVIQCATHPTEGKQRVVGWYEKATCYAKYNKGRDTNSHNFKCRFSDAVLLPLGSARETLIPREKGGFGQSNILYLYKNGKKKEFSWLDEILDFIKTYNGINILTHGTTILGETTTTGSAESGSDLNKITSLKQTVKSNSIVYPADEKSAEIINSNKCDPYSVIKNIQSKHTLRRIDIATFTFRYSALEELKSKADVPYRLIIQPAGGVDKASVTKLIQANHEGWIEARQLPSNFPLQHAKMHNLICDAEPNYYSIIGSANLTNGGFIRNFEYCLLKSFDNCETDSNAPHNWFEQLWQKTEELQADQYSDDSQLNLNPLVNAPNAEQNISGLFPFQKLAVDNFVDQYHSNQGKLQGMIVLPTGAGKTRIASYALLALAQQNPKLRVLWLAHATELVSQAWDDLNRTFLYENNLDFVLQPIYDDKMQRRDYPGIFLSTINKAYSAIKDFSKAKLFDVIVIDEAHRAADETEMYDTVLKNVKSNCKLGLTATPYRYLGEQQALVAYFGQQGKNSKEIHLIYNNTFEKLETHSEEFTGGRQIFSKLKSQVVPTGFKLPKNIDDLAKPLNNFKNKRYRNKVIEFIERELNNFGRGILFAVDVEHANQLAEEINHNEKLAQVFHTGKIKQSGCVLEDIDDGQLNDYNRARIIKKFKAGDIKILIGIELLSEGVDLPDVDAIFLARPTYSTRMLIQMIGRGMRGPAVGGTPSCKVYDFVDQQSHHKNLHDILVNYEKSDLDEDSGLLERELVLVKKGNRKKL